MKKGASRIFKAGLSQMALAFVSKLKQPRRLCPSLAKHATINIIIT